MSSTKDQLMRRVDDLSTRLAQEVMKEPSLTVVIAATLNLLMYLLRNEMPREEAEDIMRELMSCLHRELNEHHPTVQ